jgi:hypothetical protein
MKQNEQLLKNKSVLYILIIMKTPKYLFIILGFSLLVSSCTLFKPKYGCRSDGKNVGAEKVLDGEKRPKAKKFKA